MSLRKKLLLLVTLSIAISVGAVAWLLEARTRESFRQVEQERTAALVGQFRHDFDREGSEVIRGVEAVANSESMLQMGLELSSGLDAGGYVNAAQSYASVQHLDFLDLLTPDGAIISSAHWPARFGYKQGWFLEKSAAVPQIAFLKQVETPDGNVLGILCLRAVKVRGLNYYVLGGRRLDAAFLKALSTPPGMRVLIYSSPEQGAGGFLSAANDGLDTTKLAPVAQKAQEQRGESSAVIDWGSGQQESFDAIALPGLADRPPAVLLVGNSLQQQLALEEHIRNIVMLIAVSGVFIGVILSSVVATRITQPVKELASAAAEIGSGNWHVHVETTSHDEIGRLARAFNQMTEELVTQRERLVQSERVAAWRELARRLAHELKNPLFPLQITVENLLRARQAGPEQFEEVFRESTSTLLAEIANLKTIIGRFSDFSKMPAPQFQAVDLDDMVLSVVKLFQGQLMREPNPIQADLQLGRIPAVKADPVLLRRVIENLVLNAVDAMPKGGKLTFRTRTADKYALFELTDTGQGLTPEECERLFTPYYTTKQHGTGLGLAIAQSVISDHQGRISVSSRKNEGTTFLIEVPLWETETEIEIAADWEN
ncbi:MAG TPA: HAMP domain-containing sensor histidine kinase [Candidatus Solibacter sp.]|jgi:two-component system nitrogen regulation sensor histidine kinase NtrY|nr:HAMP domain-containing sensor histidine kinase [Candidatus Solibacter sp.]